MIMSTFSLSSVYAQLTSFANLENFWSLFNTVFGSSYDYLTAATLRSQWQSGDFSQFPQIEVVSGHVLGSAKGAYAISTNRIYLSDAFISSASQQSLVAVILEEFGHFVDAQVNTKDTPGDEGELFSALVRGVSLSPSELVRMKGENDWAVIVVNGQAVAVEQSITQVGVWDQLSLSYANAVAVVGNYAYAVGGNELDIIDISNPSNPIQKGHFYTTGYAWGIQVVGNYAYVADVDSGLQIINISNPAAPSLIGTYDTTSYAYGVQVVGNYAYVADRDSGLQIINISNPAAPSLIGTYDTTGYAHGVQVVGNYAYVADSGSGLQIINISNPAVPSLAGTYDTTGNAFGVQVVGNYAYVADFGSGLQIINISNPAAPSLAGTYDTTGYAVGVQIVGNYAYVADNYSGLQIINISNPAAPSLTGTYDTNDTAGVQVVGNYAYVADGYSGLQIINISNPAAPSLAGTYDTTGYAGGVQVVGNYAYVADRYGGLKILDVSDFTNIPVNQSPTDLALSNNTIAENQTIGTAIGTFTTTDPDTGNTFTYSLVAGTGSTDNALFAISGNQLQSNGIFDFESQNSYSIRVRTTDQGGLSFEKQLAIGVTDLNEIIGNPSINNGRNPIVGTAGPDYLTGGAGAKTLTGGGGNDSFVFTNMRDVGQRIADFTVGEDKLVFAQLFSNLGYTGSDPIADGYIKFVQGTGANAANTFLQIDRDGLTGSAIARNFLQVDNITTTQLNNPNNFQF